LKKKTKEEAISILNSKGLNISVEGTEGIVMIQDPTPGQVVDTGNVVKVTIQKEVTEGH
jgi:PASTA domain